MIAIQLSLSVFPVFMLMVCAFVAGFLVRGGRLKVFRKKVLDLEKEMLSNHADILALEKEKAILLKQMKESKIPVIPMNPAKEEADKPGNLQAR